MHVLSTVVWQITNRELATIVFTMFVIAGTLMIPGVQKSAAALLRAFFHPTILFVLACSFIYSGCLVYILYRIGIWDEYLLKDTMLWFLTSAMFAGLTNVSKHDGLGVSSSWISKYLTVWIVPAFITARYTYSFVMELGLVFAIVLMVCIEVSLRSNETHKVAHKLSSLILGLVCVSVFVLSIVRMAQDESEILSIATIREFLLEPVLSALYMPYIFCVLLFSEYGKLFANLKIGIVAEKSPQLRAYARRALIATFRMNLRSVHAFSKGFSLKMRRIRTPEDLNSLIVEYQRKADCRP